jgi:hypothetical protein
VGYDGLEQTSKPSVQYAVIVQNGRHHMDSLKLAMEAGFRSQKLINSTNQGLPKSPHPPKKECTP